MAGRALNALAMDKNPGGGPMQPMVVRVVLPSRKDSVGAMSDAAVLTDTDASQEDVLKAVRRLAALAKSSKFVQGGSKAATPVIKALLAVVRSSSTGPKDEQVLLVNHTPEPT